MHYKFKDMLEPSLYETASLVFVVGSHTVFNNIVCDRLRDTCISDVPLLSRGVSISEFDFDNSFDKSDDTEDNKNINSVDFNTFMDVCNIASILGKWYCATPYNILTAKQKERLKRYIQSPSEYGLLVITSSDYMEYRELLQIKKLRYSKNAHIVELGFPNKKVLQEIVKGKFADKGLLITDTATDLFVTKMSAAYDEYDDVISKIRDTHQGKEIGIADLKVYMKGIEHFVIEDFVRALMEPVTSSKTNNKKILRIMSYLIDEYGAETLIFKLKKIVDESIRFRILINDGYIPIGIRYFFKDVINDIGKDSDYAKMNEWVFRRKAQLASMTSLRDWEYISILLDRVIVDEMNRTDEKCKKALYEVCMRTVLTSSRIDNDIGISNVLNIQMEKLNRIKFDDNALSKINIQEV